MAPKLDSATGGLSGDQFLKHYRDLKQTRRAMETAVADYRGSLKRMKSDGVDTFALGLLEKLVKVEEEQATLHLRNLVTYADWTKANIGVRQGDMFVGADMPQPTEAATEAFVESVSEDNGYRAGRARDRADTNPHAPASAAHAAWARGWKRGQAEEVTTQFGGAPKKAPKPAAVPTRRGRNPAAVKARDAAPAVDAAMAKLDEAEGDPAAPEAPAAADTAAERDAEFDAAAPKAAGDNVFPIDARRPRAGTAKPVDPKVRAKADKAALKAANKLTGTAKVAGIDASKPAF